MRFSGLMNMIFPRLQTPLHAAAGKVPEDLCFGPLSPHSGCQHFPKTSEPHREPSKMLVNSAIFLCFTFFYFKAFIIGKKKLNKRLTLVNIFTVFKCLISKSKTSQKQFGVPLAYLELGYYSDCRNCGLFSVLPCVTKYEGFFSLSFGIEQESLATKESRNLY